MFHKWLVLSAKKSTFENIDQLPTDHNNCEIFNCVLSLENEIAKLSQIAKFNHDEI